MYGWLSGLLVGMRLYWDETVQSHPNQQTRQPPILTYSMLQSPSWEANWFAANQEIPRISRNPKVHYHIHKRPPPVSILGQPNPVHIPTSHLPEILILSTHLRLGLPSGLFPSGFPTKTLYTPLSSPIRETATHEKYQCRIDTVNSPDDGHIVDRNM